MKPTKQPKPHPAPRSQMAEDVDTVMVLADNHIKHLASNLVPARELREALTRIRPLLEAAPDFITILEQIRADVREYGEDDNYDHQKFYEHMNANADDIDTALRRVRSER